MVDFQSVVKMESGSCGEVGSADEGGVRF